MNKNKTKKVRIIIGCVAGGVVIIALAAVLLIKFLGHGEKSVVCTMSEVTNSIAFDQETHFTVKDGEIPSGHVIVRIDLKNMDDRYRGFEKDMVDEFTEEYKEHCGDHCTFNYDYVEGESIKYTMQYDEEGVDELFLTSAIEDMSVQEIADKVQEGLEEAGMTCAQR